MQPSPRLLNALLVFALSAALTVPLLANDAAPETTDQVSSEGGLEDLWGSAELGTCEVLCESMRPSAYPYSGMTLEQCCNDPLFCPDGTMGEPGLWWSNDGQAWGCFMLDP